MSNGASGYARGGHRASLVPAEQWSLQRASLHLDQDRAPGIRDRVDRSEEHTSELQSLMRISYAVFCLKNKKRKKADTQPTHKQIIIQQRHIHNNDKHKVKI